LVEVGLDPGLWEKNNCLGFYTSEEDS
jgi:hypothetical protein